MPVNTRIKLVGFKEADDIFRQMPTLAKRVLRQSLRERSKPILNDWKGNYRRLSGSGKSSSGVARRLAKDLGAVNSRDNSGNVAVDIKHRGKEGRWVYGMSSIFEYGTVTRLPKKSKYLVFQDDDGNWVKVTSARGMSPQAPGRNAWDGRLNETKKGLRRTVIKKLSDFMDRKLARTRNLR